MFKGEWERVKRAKGGTVPKLRGLTCPMLSPTGKCTVYSVRPYICRLWGTTRELRCPEGCEPDRWLSIEQSMDIYTRIREIAGPQTAGPLGTVENLWEAIALQPRAERLELIERIKEVANADRQT
jgi:Fe-S-cluster containining protein